MVSWSPPPLPRLPTPPQWRWPPWRRGNKKEEEEKRVREELERRRLQIKDLCQALKVYTQSDLNDLLCSMVLCECVYKVVRESNICFILLLLNAIILSECLIFCELVSFKRNDNLFFPLWIRTREEVIFVLL